MKKLIFPIILIVLLFFALSFPINSAIAANMEGAGPVSSENIPKAQLKLSCPDKNIFSLFTDEDTNGIRYLSLQYAICIIQAVINLLLSFAWMVAGLMVAISGVKYVVSAAVPAQREEALKSLNSALIGFAITLMAYSIIRFIMEFIEFSTIAS